ncbi:fungal-specific transcription factor domain-containing protein [Fusarium oxysporum f. sp. albedinis]|nr:fungal-specific transcription factor domain-containing protein [Fusarium oxysporum f. sp. albedinis]KAJ0129387.1 putative AC9 transposase [Fusarium oxysporum f. sp. albedinis]
MSSSSPHRSLSDNQSPLSGSKLRQLVPAPGSNSEGTSSDSSQGPSLQPRPLPRANLTKIACEPCRKRKAKCCGERPKCKACINKGLECHYQASDQDLFDLKRKHDEIQEKVNVYERLYDLLMKLPEQDSHAILDRLRGGPDVATTILQVDDGDFLLQLASALETRLCKGQAVETPSDWLRGALPSGCGVLSAVATSGSHNANLGDASTSTPASGTSGAASCLLSLEPENATSSNPDAKVMSSSKDRPGLSLSRITSRAEGMQNDHMPDGLPRSHGLDHVQSTLNQREWEHHPPSWTTITNDTNLILHLLALYFCWEYPVFAPLSKKHFLQDFRDGRHRYCSPLLVNALLALGCRFSTNLITRTNSRDPQSADDHFFKESQRLFDQETDHHSLTTIQALGIMSIREASCGRGSESRYYAGQSIRLAFEMGLHRTPDNGDKEELAVQLATFWGAFSLDNSSSLVTGSLPNCSYTPHLPSKPAVIRDIEASVWVPYTDDGAPLQLQYEQPSNERSVYKCLCELSELVHKSLYLLHSPRKSITAQGLLGIYTEYLDWYNGVPEVLRLGHNFTPAVLFAHMYYHFATLLLFWPFAKLRIIESNISPRDVCLQAANAIQGFLTSYSRLYTLKWAPSFVPYFALASSIMHLALMAGTIQINKLDTAARTEPHLSEAVKQDIARLAEMTHSHHVAEQALHLLHHLAKKWNINVNIEIGAALDPEEYEKLGRSFGGIVNFFSPTMVAQDSISVSVTDKDVRETTPCQPGKAVENLEDLLFLPSAMQGLPMFVKDEALEEAGFAVL